MGSRDARPAVGRVKGLLRQKEALPRPVKITKTCGAQRGKVDFIPLKFGRQLQGRVQFCPINICLTHKSVDSRAFLPRPAPPRPVA